MSEPVFERRLQQTLAIMRDPLCTIDDEFRFLTVNPAAEAYMGVPAAAVLGKRMADVFPQFQGSELQRQLEGARADRAERHFEIESRLRPGTWYEVNVYPASEGFLLYYRDITARRRDEQAVREARAELQLVTDTMAAQVARCSKDGRFLWVSRAYAQRRGHTPEAVVGRSIREVLGEQAWSAIAPHVARVLQGESVRYEASIDYPDQGSRWIEAHYEPTRGAEGEPDGWVAMIVDIDERRRAEEELRDASRRKDEFLAMLAHELRNPLAPIRNSVHVLKLIGPPEPRLMAVRDMIDRQVAHMARLLDDLLDVSRITRGKVLLKKEPLDVRDVVRSCAEDLRGLLERNQIQLAVDIGDTPLPVVGDPTRLAQVVGNLLQNANKFTNPGGQVRVAARRERDHAVVSVSDTGVGIDPAFLPRVFDAFAQGDPSLDRSTGGLGLGLALVKGLVDLHGGSADARSPGRGRGSTFTLRLPLVRNAEAAPAPRPATAPARGRRVLVVEDHADVAESLRVLLEVLGHHVVVARTGRAAVDMVAREVPDVVLCDIGLAGGMDGYAVARELRQEHGRRVRLVALSGYGQDEDKARAAAAGFDRHLTKPVDPVRLQDVLEEVP